MMLRQTAIPFNDTGKMLAGAMHDAGATDREIADACNTSVNNIIWWRRETSRAENLTEEAKARAAEEAWSPPVSRPATGSPPPATAPQLLSPQEAQSAHVSVVTPTGDDAIEIGLHMDAKVFLDLPEMLTTRLLIQGNSGSGKTHLLRRLLEECTGIVQQIIIDPEGDFVSFGEVFGHTVIEAKDLKPSRLRKIAARVRTLRGSVVVSLEGLFIDQQMEAVAAFLGGLFDADAEHWHPAIVAIDEAHLFAPSGSNGEDADARKASLQAMANLMCRGRKRGLAGVIATQRLAKIAKNVAAEASNFLMGRTYLDIDISRASDLLGINQRDSEQIRNLSRGEFIGLGPAIARRTIKVKVGPVMTQGRAGQEKGITPLPTLRPEEMQAALLADDEAEDETPAVVVPFARKA